MYTGRGKGGPSPYEEVGLLRRPLPLLLNTYIPYSIPPPRFNESLDIPIILTMTAPPQHKQRYYYIFWSIATLSVVIGQINVINTYNRLSDNLETIIIEQAREKILKATKESSEVYYKEESTEDTQ